MAKFRKPMQRQLSEAINIENTKSNELLNLKNEYFKNSIKGVELSCKQCICKYCSRAFEDKNELMKHIEYIHKNYECQQCDYKAFGSCDYLNHVKQTHA